MKLSGVFFMTTISLLTSTSKDKSDFSY